MNSLNISALQRNRDAIVSDLVVNDVIDKLISKLVINEEDKGLIDKENNDKDKARQLLDILANKNNKAYEIFREVLEPDYEWLAKLLVINTTSELVESIQQDALTIGGVPRDPPYYVERKDILKTVKIGLLNLKRSQFLLLHGMPGSGKSCLAQSAICDSEILSKMTNRVYWCNVGECTTTERIQQHLHRLYLKLQSEMSNRTNRPISVLMSEKLEHIHDNLRCLFTRDEFRDALLVLDDVLDSHTLEMFDFGCKMLITSKNKEIFNKVNNKDVQVIDVKAFTENESVQLFSNCMNTKIDTLSMVQLKNLKTIHNLCRGLPMIIALIGGQLKLPYSAEVSRIERMEDCIKRLSNHDDFYKSNQVIFSVIDICVNDLPKGIKQKFQDLVIFLEDVNVPTCVLQLLWDETKYSVEDIMTELKNRSLVLGQINPQNREFVFGLHDLLHAYLKERLSAAEIRNTHIKLIDAYRKKCNNDFSKLPNDNYIYSYLAYHFEEAEQSLPDIYLDLNFIGAKIRATTAADLLTDLRKYREKIINGDKLRKSQLNEMEEFVKDCGYNLYRYPDLCVIQLALSWRTGYLKALASDIVKKKTDRLFVDIWCKEKGPPHPQILDLNSVPIVARFAIDTNQILIGCSDGAIEMWDLNYYRLRARFDGHKKPLKCLRVSPTCENFVSLSEDGESRLWNIPSTLSHSNSFANGTPNGSPSPIIKQKQWSSLYDTDASKFSSLHIFESDSDKKFKLVSYSNNGEYICLCSDNGFINIFDVMTSQTVVVRNIEIENIISCCFYKKNYIMIGTSSNEIWLFNILQSEHKSKFNCEQQSIHLLTNKFGMGISIAPTSIGYFKSQSIVELHDNIKCTFANITPEGDILVTGNTESITIFEVKYDEYGYIEKLEVLHFIEDFCGEVSSVDIYQNSPCIYLLVTIKNKKLIKIWCLQPGDFSTDYNKTSRRLPIFDCIFDPLPITPDGKDTMKTLSQQLSNNSLGIQNFGLKFSTCSPNSLRHINDNYQLAVADSSCKLQIQRGHNIYYTNVNEQSYKINCISMSACGLFIAYGLDNGYIFVYQTKLDSSKKIIKLPDSACYLEFINDLTLIAAGSSGSLMTWQKEFSIKLQDIIGVQEPKIEKSINIYAEKIVKCFAYKNYIISISSNCSIKLWCLENEHKLVSVLWGNPSAKGYVTCAALQKNSLAVGNNDGSLLIFSLKNIKEDNIENFRALCIHKYDVDVPIVSLDIALDQSVIALGLDNGDIRLWSTINSSQICVLKLHKTAVHHLCFAHEISNSSPLILLSTSDVLAWWNISYCLEKYVNSSNQNKYKRKKSLDTINHFRELNLKNITNPDKWRNKSGPDWRPELLICVKIQGKHAFKVIYNDFFTSFVTVDDSGQFYLMRLK